MKGKAYSCGAGTIINAIANWKGCSFGVDLKTYAEVELSEGTGNIKGEIDVGGDTSLIERCVRLVLERFNVQDSYDGIVKTTSEIPIARGLKSSSAAANATVLATLNAIGETLDPLEAVKLGVLAAQDVGVTITGAFDDACASFFGGIVITNNKKMELIKRFEYNSLVLIFVPSERAYTANTNVSRSRVIAPLVDIAWNFARNGKFKVAMTLNGFLYCSALGFDTEVMMRALEKGVNGVSLSGTGPAFTALVDENNIDSVCDAWSDLGGEIIKTKINNKVVWGKGFARLISMIH